MRGDVLPTVALALIGLYGLATLLGRTVIQRHRERDSGWRGISGRPGSAAWWGGVLLAIGALGLPLAAGLAPTEADVSLARVVFGALGFAVGLGFTIYAQLAMGRSWRIGVREGERTELVTSGPFRWCRNPVFTGMLVTVSALAIWVPAIAVPAGVILLALELQVRVVEEPNLLHVHGDAYRGYASRTGRFLPGLGRGL